MRKCDLYGHPIRLNFNGDTEIRSTFGGCISLFAIACMIIYVSVITARLFPWHQETAHNLMSFSNQQVDLSIPLNYSTTGLEMYAVMEKAGAQVDRRDLKRYVNISFAYGNDDSKVYFPSK